jgi:hypothetical protein
MVAVKKLRKNVVKYCNHCDDRALYVLYFTNTVIIQQGSNGALCKRCMELLKTAVVKATSPNKSLPFNKTRIVFIAEPIEK